MADEYEEILAGTVALGYLDCTLLEYARGIKYYIDQEARKYNCDTHLVNMLRRAACVGWENIYLFHAPVTQPLLLSIERLKRYEAALQDIANQRLRSELEPIDGEISGDFEGAYDAMINVARNALAGSDTKDESVIRS